MVWRSLIVAVNDIAHKWINLVCPVATAERAVIVDRFCIRCVFLKDGSALHNSWVARIRPMAQIWACRAQFVKKLRYVQPGSTQLRIEIQASGISVHSQKLGYTAFSRSPHTGREKFATGPIFVIANRLTDDGRALRARESLPSTNASCRQGRQCRHPHGQTARSDTAQPWAPRHPPASCSRPPELQCHPCRGPGTLGLSATATRGLADQGYAIPV